jgi:hypothetical protein
MIRLLAGYVVDLYAIARGSLAAKIHSVRSLRSKDPHCETVFISDWEMRVGPVTVLLSRTDLIMCSCGRVFYKTRHPLDPVQQAFEETIRENARGNTHT